MIKNFLIYNTFPVAAKSFISSWVKACVPSFIRPADATIVLDTSLVSITHREGRIRPINSLVLVNSCRSIIPGRNIPNLKNPIPLNESSRLPNVRNNPIQEPAFAPAELTKYIDSTPSFLHAPPNATGNVKSDSSVYGEEPIAQNATVGVEGSVGLNSFEFLRWAQSILCTTSFSEIFASSAPENVSDGLGMSERVRATIFEHFSELMRSRTIQRPVAPVDPATTATKLSVPSVALNFCMKPGNFFVDPP